MKVNTQTLNQHMIHIFTFLWVISEQLAGLVALCVQTQLDGEQTTVVSTQHSLLDGLVLSLTDATPHEMRHIKT